MCVSAVMCGCGRSHWLLIGQMVHSPWVQPEKIATLISAVFLHRVTCVLGVYCNTFMRRQLHEVDIKHICLCHRRHHLPFYRNMSAKPSDTRECVCVRACLFVDQFLGMEVEYFYS